MNRYIHKKIIDNITYYGKYLSTVIDNIDGIKELCYLGVTASYLKPVYVYDSIWINIISTTMLKINSPVAYISLKKVLKKIMRLDLSMTAAGYNIFMENIKIIEIVRKKLVFLNKYEINPIKKITYIKNDFLNKLYEEYLENKFNVIIIDEDNKYEVGLEYKDIYKEIV